MLTLEDCVALCQLTKEEVDAISEHEHLPDIIAAELGNYLVHSADGQVLIRRMIVDDIGHARARGDFNRMSLLIGILRHYIETHPQARGAAS